jgi:cytochrome P450
VVTRYADILTVLHEFSADRTPSPRQMAAMGLSALEPLAEMMVKQMLFLDAPAHSRLRRLCLTGFTPRRVEKLIPAIQDIADRLIDEVAPTGCMDVIADFASPFPAIVAAGLLGVPADDHRQLKQWSADFAEMLGNFQHNPDRAPRMLHTVQEMTTYFREIIRELKRNPRDCLIHSLLEAEQDGERLTEDEVIANTIVTMVGGQETTTNLIGNGMLTLLRQPDLLQQLREHPEISPTAIEELLRYESPSQHTARIAPFDIVLGGKLIRKGDAVMVVMAAGNRDPDRFEDPDRVDLQRKDNRHLAFGWAAHFCFGAPLARIEGQVGFASLLRRLPDPVLATEHLAWRTNSGLRGLTSLPIRFQPGKPLA